MEFPYKQLLKNEKDTENVAEIFSKILRNGDVIALNGELGVGKTFLIKSICKQWNIRNVNSPSFTILNRYNGDHLVYHFDFYRIKKNEELFDLGFEEYACDEQAIKFIEWAYTIRDVIPQKHFLVELNFKTNNTRELFISKNE